MKSKVSRKNRFKKSKIGSGYEYLNSPDIENQFDNVRYENIPDIENQLNEDTYESIDNVSDDNDSDNNMDIDKPKNIIEYVPLQKETSIEPIEEDIESNIPSDTSIDLGESGYGVYDKQFYGGLTRKRRSKSKRNKSKSKSKRGKNKRNKSKRNKSKRNKSKK